MKQQQQQQQQQQQHYSSLTPTVAPQYISKYVPCVF